MSATGQKGVTLPVPGGATAAPSPPSQGRYHLMLGISPEMNGVIEKLALRYQCDEADVLNMAVGLLNYLSDSASEGKRVGVAATDQDLESEIEL